MTNNMEAEENNEKIMQIDRILNRFSPNFKEKLRINPMYYHVYHLLLQGMDEYLIIEELLKINEQRNNDLIKLSENQQPKYYIKLP
jgi:hypothetical protein